MREGFSAQTVGRRRAGGRVDARWAVGTLWGQRVGSLKYLVVLSHLDLRRERFALS